MKVFLPIVFSILLSLLAPNVSAQAPQECTTTEKIQFPKSMRVPPELDADAAREVILVALGNADVDVSWARDTFDGQWFYEYELDGVTFAGYSVRSHYLQVAITYGEGNITTIVCDSRNLDQSAKKIHRKVPGWKGTLDDNLRIAMGQASQYYRENPRAVSGDSMETHIKSLNNLREAGILSDEEYRDLRQRVLDSQ